MWSIHPEATPPRDFLATDTLACEPVITAFPRAFHAQLFYSVAVVLAFVVIGLCLSTNLRLLLSFGGRSDDAEGKSDGTQNNNLSFQRFDSFHSERKCSRKTLRCYFPFSSISSTLLLSPLPQASDRQTYPLPADGKPFRPSA